MSSAETRIVDRFFDKPGARDDVVLGIGDDAAAVRVPAGTELICTIDTIVAGVHFPDDLDAADIGYRAVAVNLSDIAAMGAIPAWALLSLSVPAANDTWLGRFSDGFFALAGAHDVALIGGDLVSGPLCVTVTLLGHVPAGRGVTRSGARPGDLVYVTGVPGTASRGLASLMKTGAHDRVAEQAFRRPQPRVAEGISLRGLATAMTDVSDGILTETRHIAAASGVRIAFDEPALREAADGWIDAALCGGDDYELCFTAPSGGDERLRQIAAGWGCRLTRIGEVTGGSGVVLPGRDLDGLAGYDHFRGTSG